MSHPKSKNITWSHSSVSREERREKLGHGAATIWFTGLSGSGKSTVALAAERELIDRGKLAYVLDGDNVRHGRPRIGPRTFAALEKWPSSSTTRA